MSTEEAAARVNAAIKKSTTDLPQIEDVPDTSVKLLMGIQDIDGVWHTDAVVRELNGEDEEALSGLESKANVSYGDYMSTLLTRAVVSVGTLDVSGSPSVIDELTVPDRDLLFIGVIRATYGKQRQFVMKCPACEGSNDINVDLTDGFPVSGTTEEMREKRTVTLRNGSEVTIKHPTGADSRFVAKFSNTSAEQNTALIARCVSGHGAADAITWARKLSLPDRKVLIKEILGRKFGPQAEEVNAPCGHCGENISLTVDWASLLLG